MSSISSSRVASSLTRLDLSLSIRSRRMLSFFSSGHSSTTHLRSLVVPFFAAPLVRFQALVRYLPPKALWTLAKALCSDNHDQRCLSGGSTPPSSVNRTPAISKVCRNTIRVAGTGADCPVSNLLIVVTPILDRADNSRTPHSRAARAMRHCTAVIMRYHYNWTPLDASKHSGYNITVI